MASGNKRSAEVDLLDDEKASKQSNCTTESVATILTPNKCDLSSLEGILALLSFDFEGIVGFGKMKDFIILRYLYAARVEGVDLFLLGQVFEYYFNSHSRVESPLSSLFRQLSYQIFRQVTPLLRSTQLRLLVLISRRYAFAGMLMVIFLVNSFGTNVITFFKKCANPRATKVRLPWHLGSPRLYGGHTRGATTKVTLQTCPRKLKMISLKDAPCG